MNKHRVKNFFKTSGVSRFARLFVVVSLVTVSLAGVSQQANAAQTWANYCQPYKAGSGLSFSACRDGVIGTVDCSEYADLSTQGDVTICENAKNAKKNGTISDSPLTAPTTTTPSTTSPDSTIDANAYRNNILLTCASYGDTAQQLACLYGGLGKNGSSTTPTSAADCYTALQFLANPDAQKACSSGSQAGQTYINSQKNQNKNPNSSTGSPNNLFSSLDLNDTQGNLSDYINMLHANGTDSKVNTSNFSDNNPGSYVNGAGGQQPIKVMPSGKPNSPALIWFNGGGWHANDGTAQLIASGSTQKNGGDQQEAAPVGGGANARGYTVIEVTYRLGSSGVNYMFEDVMRGIQHVINNAKLYDIDPSKIVIGGDSAGGSLSMRAAASGKSGAKVAIGWSAPTNAYTGLFKSYKTFLIGIDHSTCIPTDLAGLANTTDLLNGGSGNVAQYGQGLSSNEFDNLGLSQGQNGIISGVQDPSSNPLLIVSQTLAAAQYASSSSQNVEAISKQIENKDFTGLSKGVFNLSAHKLTECIGNFNSLSPALFASTETPPSFLAGFDTDDLIDPQQAHDMVDKLQQMGIKADSLIVPGDPDATQDALGATGNHLGYDPRFVCATINFMDSIIQPGVKTPDCSKPSSVTQSAPTDAGSSGSGGGSSSGNSSSGGGGSNSGGGQSSSCTLFGKTFNPGDANYNGCQQVTSCSNKPGMTYNVSSGQCTQNTSTPAAPGNNLSNYTCLNGDKLSVNADGGVQCTYDYSSITGTQYNNCGGARALPGGGCAYGAIQGYHQATTSGPNCTSMGGRDFQPGSFWGSFSGTCLVPN